MELTYLKAFCTHHKNTSKLYLRIELEDDLLLSYIDSRMKSGKGYNDVYNTIWDKISYSKENLSTFDCEGFRDFLNAVKNRDIRKARELLYEFLSEE